MNSKHSAKYCYRVAACAVAATFTAYCGSGEAGFGAGWLPAALVANVAAPGSPALPAGPATDYNMVVRDLPADGAFAFDTIAALDLNIEMTAGGTPLAGNLVQFRTIRDGSAREVVFQAVTDETGRIQGNCTIATTTETLRLDFTNGGRLYTVAVNVAGLGAIDRTIVIQKTSAANDQANASALTALSIDDDRDQDGVPNAADHFPDDPNRATLLRFPEDGGRFTVAFEDLYPRRGDADFNDYVLQFKQEEHLDAQGRVVRILGSYRHVAKAAGYRHTLRLTLPIEQADYTLKRFDPAGVLVSTRTETPAQFENVKLTERSNTTIPHSNGSRGQEFLAGDLFEIDIQPNAPVAKTDLGAAPYDLFLKVENTGREVHFAGKFFDAQNQDEYLDDEGFPWALLVPVDWRWMYERENIHDAYEFFANWYESAGVSNRDWYLFPDLSLVVSSALTRFSQQPEFTPPAGYNPQDFMVNESLRPVPARINDDYTPIGAIYDIDPVAGGTIIFPGDPGEIQFEYDRDALIDAGLPENFTVFFYDANGDRWLPVMETVADPDNEVVVARTSHLTPFVLAVSKPTAGEVCVDFPSSISVDGVPALTCSAVGPLILECQNFGGGPFSKWTFTYPSIEAAQASLFDGPFPNAFCNNPPNPTDCRGLGGWPWFRGTNMTIGPSIQSNPPSEISFVFELDGLNRLISLSNPYSPAPPATYSDYDANGFPQTMSSGSTIFSNIYSYEYDPGGTLPRKMVIDNNLTIEYDTFGRQTRASNIIGGWTHDITTIGGTQLCGIPSAPLPGPLVGGNIIAPLNLTNNVSTFAGDGTAGLVDGAGVAARFNFPDGIATDGTSLFIAENSNHTIRQIDIASGTVSTLAGDGTPGFADGAGATARFRFPAGITTDGTFLYVVDNTNNRIRRVTIASGLVTTIAGNGAPALIDGVGTSAGFNFPSGITMSGNNLFVTELGSHSIRQIDIATNTVSTLAGDASVTAGFADGTGPAAQFYSPHNITTDGTNLYVADRNNHRIRRIVIGTGVVTTIAGNGTAVSTDGNGTSAGLRTPTGIAYDGVNLWITDQQAHVLRKMDLTTGAVTTSAGANLSPGLVNGTGASARFRFPAALCTDGSSLYAAGQYNHAIRRIN